MSATERGAVSAGCYDPRRSDQMPNPNTNMTLHLAFGNNLAVFLWPLSYGGKSKCQIIATFSLNMAYFRNGGDALRIESLLELL